MRDAILGDTASEAQVGVFLLDVELAHGVGQSDPDALCNLAGDAHGVAAYHEGLAIVGNRRFGR